MCATRTLYAQVNFYVKKKILNLSIYRDSVSANSNFALLRRLVNNLLQHERSVKRGIKAKRLKAALNANYLLKVLRL